MHGGIGAGARLFERTLRQGEAARLVAVAERHVGEHALDAGTDVERKVVTRLERGRGAIRQLGDGHAATAAVLGTRGGEHAVEEVRGLPGPQAFGERPLLLAPGHAGERKQRGERGAGRRRGERMAGDQLRGAVGQGGPAGGNRTAAGARVQVVGEGAGRGVTRTPVGRQGLLQDHFEVAREFGSQAGHRRAPACRRLGRDRLGDTARCFTPEHAIRRRDE